MGCITNNHLLKTKLTESEKIMDIIEISVPEDWDAEQDLEEFEDRFGDDYKNLQKFALDQVDDACAQRKHVLAQAIRYFLQRTTTPLRVPVSALTVPELCHFLLEIIAQSGRKRAYIERFEEHLAAVLHYEEQRALVLERHWTNPDHVWLIELADLADTIVTASMEFDEGMECEHDNYTSALDNYPPE